VGTGNWTQRRLSRPIEEIQQTQGWKTIQQELLAEEAELGEETAAFRYDNSTPQGTAAATLHFRYDMPYYVPRGVASMRTAPFAYWQIGRAPELTDTEEKQWVGRIEQELTSYCDLLRQIYGRPNLAQPATAADCGP
jgi:hypothetical protein